MDGDRGETVTRRRRPLLAALLATVLMAAGCGDDGTTSADGTTGADSTPGTEPATTGPSGTDAPAGPAETPTSGDVELTATHRGVTADTIHIGAALIDIDPLYEAGLYTSTWGDQDLVWQTLVDDLNARGGIHGRTVEVSTEFYSPADTVDADALCVTFNEDIEVFAVLNAFAGPAESATPCLTDNPELTVVGGTFKDEYLATAEAAWFGGGRRDSRTIPAMIELLDQQGLLDDVSVAVVTGDENVTDTDDILLPTLDEYGVDVVMTAVQDVPGTDIPAEDRLWDVFAERIRTSGADTVVINGDTTSALRSIARNDLDVDMWVIKADQLVSLGSSATREDAEGAITIQGLTDVEAWDDPLMRDCVQVFTDAHPDIVVKGPAEVALEEPHWNLSLGQACVNLALFELLATAAGPDLTPESIRAGALTLTDFSLPGVPNASFAPGKPDANDSARLTVSDITAGPAGGMVPLTEIVDLAD